MGSDFWGRFHEPSQASPPVPKLCLGRAAEPDALSCVWGGRTSLEPWIGPPLGTLCLRSGLSGLRACLHGRRGRKGPDAVPAFVLALRPIGGPSPHPSIMITTNIHETHPLCQAHGCEGCSQTPRGHCCDHPVSVEAEASQSFSNSPEFTQLVTGGAGRTASPCHCPPWWAPACPRGNRTC